MVKVTFMPISLCVKIRKLQMIVIFLIESINVKVVICEILSAFIIIWAERKYKCNCKFLLSLPIYSTFHVLLNFNVSIYD